jgi:uncharacterized protein YegJ (DUF2314 family)
MENFGFVHGECAENRKQTWQIDNAGKILQVGEFVKIGLPILNPISLAPSKEYIWVELTEIKETTYLGKIDNIPVYAPIVYGDVVEFTFDEIMEWMAAD